ncbi:hypothetical protein H072_5335 [Dactylellina haptotyla CBS 200.50]|uniref:DUF202 domain-containing protein n=1 Tax=Dactylellina haptotyla (strain CBS 200.50) TaxID=1284197 RepID=S8AI33_DACHA|nr:hypothetical protein H072_5335 [Dactylellina haptotyla CBS 200.50]
MTGVLLAQISVIVLKDEAMAQQMGFEPKPAASHDKYSSMPPIHRAAKPLAAATVSIALVTVTIGVFRFHFSQKALIEGYAISGGWLMFGLAGMMLSFLIVVFVLTIASSDP